MENNFRTTSPQIAPPTAQDKSTNFDPILSGMESIPLKKQHTFYIRHESRIDGQVYEGQFTCKKLTIKDLSRVGVRKVQLNGGYHFDSKKPGIGIDEDTDAMNSMIAHLEQALIQAPIWFNLEEVYEGELLGKIYKEVVQFENSFFRRKPGEFESPGNSANGGSSQSQESRTSGYITPVGGREVSTALDA